MFYQRCVSCVIRPIFLANSTLLSGHCLTLDLGLQIGPHIGQMIETFDKVEFHALFNGGGGKEIHQVLDSERPADSLWKRSEREFQIIRFGQQVNNYQPEGNNLGCFSIPRADDPAYLSGGDALMIDFRVYYAEVTHPNSRAYGELRFDPRFRVRASIRGLEHSLDQNDIEFARRGLRLVITGRIPKLGPKFTYIPQTLKQGILCAMSQIENVRIRTKWRVASIFYGEDHSDLLNVNQGLKTNRK